MFAKQTYPRTDPDFQINTVKMKGANRTRPSLDQPSIFAQGSRSSQDRPGPSRVFKADV